MSAAGRGRPLVAVALAGLLVLSGCTALVGHRDAPGGDRLGWEDGYWYDDALSVTAGDGFNESERRAVVARTMARVERIRRLEFEQRVPVEVISREQYRERRASREATDGPSAYDRWNDQVWEALFLVPEERGVAAATDEVFGSTVQGFYSPARDEIVVIAPTGTPTIDRTTLAHELVHALQDQHFGFGTGADTQDRQLATDGLVEGDANYVEAEYEARCGGTWSCLERPQRGGGGGGGEFNFGLFLTVYAPYAEGPGFVSALRERDGWAAVDDAYRAFPESTEQVIHPRAYPDERPVDVTVPDRSTDQWERFDVSPVADTVGEASIYAMFWANGQVDREHRSPYNYSHPLSAGWGGDSVVPYRNGDSYGYVWTTTWDTEADAAAFVRGYRDLLRAHDATRDGDVYVVPEDDPYADAFRVTRRGRTVVVVNAPGTGDLEDVHAPR